MKTTVLRRTGLFLILVVLAFVRALTTYVFIVPNAFAPGGVAGIASILYNVVRIFNPVLAEGVFNPAITIFVLNLPLIVAAFFILNKEYAINTTIVVVLYSAFMAMFSAVNFPVFRGSGPESSLSVLAAVAGGVISGVALGGTLLTNSSSGGSDIAGKIVNKKYPESNINWCIFAFDCVVVLFSGVVGLIGAKGHSADEVFVNVASPVLFSFLTLFISSEVSDVMLTGVRSSVVFNVVTDKAKEMGEAVVRVLRRGGTVLNGEGIYTDEERKILVCVVSRKQSAALNRIIKEIDPSAFTYISKVKEVHGRGFRSGF